SLHLDSSASDGGSSLTIGGTLTNTGEIRVGNTTLSSSTTLSVQALDNEGGSLFIKGNTADGSTNQATVSVASDAGLCTTPGLLSGDVELVGNALLEFTGGQITTIEDDASLLLDGAHARIALSATPGTNSALAGLTDNEGIFHLEDGATVAVGGDLTNNGE